MKRLVWLLVVGLVVYVFGSEAWKMFNQAQKPQYTAHPEY
jgi:hypothetical protein